MIPILKTNIKEYESFIHTCLDGLDRIQINHAPSKALKEMVASYSKKARDSRIDDILEHYRYTYVIQNDEETLVGLIVMENSGPSALTISKLYILPEYRHRGIGSTVLDMVFDDCKELGIKTVFIKVFDNNKGAFKLYSSKGFRTFNRTLYVDM
jgi:ribosomal protein S18 acetylase RimI-like enzyme